MSRPLPRITRDAVTGKPIFLASESFGVVADALSTLSVSVTLLFTLSGLLL